jgi:hypothetical protein
VFENKVLRRMSDPKSKEVTEGWKKMHSVECQLVFFNKYYQIKEG